MIEFYVFHPELLVNNIGTKCNSLTQQFIGISTTIYIYMGYMFRLYRVIYRPSKTTDPIFTR